MHETGAGCFSEMWWQLVTTTDNHNHDHNQIHLFSIPDIHQSGYGSCLYITRDTIQNEPLQYNIYSNKNSSNLWLYYKHKPDITIDTVKNEKIQYNTLNKSNNNF